MPQTHLATSKPSFRFGRFVLGAVAAVALAVVGVTSLATPAAPVAEAQSSRIDYDHDNDRYIEVSDFRQFNVIRYDLDTDGVPEAANASAWREWFPRAEDNMGCPRECIGYELVSDIYISPRWSEETNFEPIGSDSDPFMGRINGNGNLIVNLRIMRSDTDQVGLFGSTGSGSIIEGLAITDPVVKGGEDVGVIVGKSLGTVRNSFAVGRRNSVRFVEGTANVGGLVGTMGSGAVLSTSYARIHVVAATEDDTGDNAGGLIGSNAGGSCVNSYYSGDVDANGSTQGLIVGAHASGSYTNCIGDSASDAGTGNVNVRNYIMRGAGADPSNSPAAILSAYVDADNPTIVAAGSGTATGASVETYRDMASQSHSDVWSTGYEYIGDPWYDDDASWNNDVDGDGVLDEPWYFGSTHDSLYRGSNCEGTPQPLTYWVCQNTGDLPVLQYGGHNPQLQINLAVPRTAVHYPQRPVILGDSLDAYPPQATVNLCERTLAVANEILRVLKFETVNPAVRAYTDCTANPTDERNVTIADLQQVGNNLASKINLRGKGLTSLKPGDFDYLTGYPLRIDLGSVHDGTNVGQDLTDNNLTTLPPRLFEGVKIAELDLSGNNITHLPWDLFGTAPLWPGECVIESGRDSRTQPGCHVSSVLLHDNQLTENGLPPAIFDPLTYLNTLTLHNNQLDKINTRWFQMLPWLGDSSTVNGQRQPFRIFKGLYLHGNAIRYRHYDSGSGLSQPVAQTLALPYQSSVSAARNVVKAAIESRIDSATQTGNAPKLDLDSTEYWQPRYQIDRIDPDQTNSDTTERVDARAGTSYITRDENSNPVTLTLEADIWVGRYRASCGALTSAYTFERNYKTSDCWIVPHYTHAGFQLEEMTDVCDGTRSPLVRRVILTDALSDPDDFTAMIDEFECPSAASNGVVSADRLYGITTLDLSDGVYGYVTGLMEGDFDGLGNLQVLNLADNYLTTESIPPTVFRGLPNLVGLYLDGNRILHVNTAWFEDLTSLGGGVSLSEGYDVAGEQGGLGLGSQEDEDGNAREVRTFYFSYTPGGPAEGEGTQVEYYDKEQLRTEIIRVITRYAGGTAPSTLDLSDVPYAAAFTLRTKYVGPEPYFATAAPPPLTVTAPGGRQSLQVNFLHRPRAADNPIVRLNPDAIIDYEYRYRITPADPTDAWSNTIGWRRAFVDGLSSAGTKTITIPNLVASSSYQIQVRPLTNGGGGTSMDRTAATSAGQTSVDITVSHTPAAGTGSDPMGVHSVSGYEFRYRVRPSDAGSSWTEVWRKATLTGLDREGQQAITIYGLEPSTIYQVQVRALSGEERGRSSPIVTITSGTLINLPEINRIEPTITDLTVQTGADIRLEVNVYGLANRLDNSIPDGDNSNLVFSWTESPATGGTFSDPNDGRRVTYTAPDLPGSYRVVAEASPNGICRPHHESAFGITEEQRRQCVATFNIRVTRAPSVVTSTAAPINPAGLIPSSLTDNAGVAYAVFTPVEGGTFSGEGISVTAPPGAVPDQDLIGVSATVTTLPVPESGPTARLTVGGSFYAVNGVRRSGDAPVTGYTFDDPLTVCLPMPNEFRGRISDIVLVDRRADGTLGMLGSRVRVAEGVISACGNVSRLPVTLAVARLGAPDPVAPEPTPEIVPPDTGATAPSTSNAVTTLVLGVLTLAGLGGVMAMAGIRRRRAAARST